MRSFLITYEYSYNEDPGKFTDVVEGESFVNATKHFKDRDNTATVLDIKELFNAVPNYRDLKNLVHNELAITKDEIRGMVEQSVERIVERKLEVMFRKYWNDDKDSEYSLYTMERIIDKAIRGRIDFWWGESEDTVEDYVKKEVARQLISSVKLKVEIAKNDKEATKSNDGIVTVRRRKQ